MIVDRETKKIIIISPHFDDAILSCGGLICKMIKLGKYVEICNVFTRIEVNKDHFSEVIKEYIAEDMNEDAQNVDVRLCEKWIRLRKKEDNRASSFLECNKRDLGYIDAIFRTRLNQYIYDTEEKLFSIVGQKDEEHLVKNVAYTIEAICKDFDKCIFPMAVGNHVDHYILYQIGLEIQKKNNNVFFYGEIPYCINFQSENEELIANKMVITELFGLKLKAIGFYETQLRGLFGDKYSVSKVIPNYEIYYKHN